MEDLRLDLVRDCDSNIYQRHDRLLPWERIHE